MLAARRVGSSEFEGLAAATAVTFDSGYDNATHAANGVEWYFSPEFPRGFAGAGDTNGMDESDRLCWHTGGGQMSGGWRAGTNTWLNGATDWEKVLLADAGAPADMPEPASLAILGLAGLAASLRKAGK